MFEIIDEAPEEGAVIKVIGVGGCGGNAVEHMITRGLSGVDFMCANTDAQALKRSTARTQLQLGSTLTRGLGAGGRHPRGLVTKICTASPQTSSVRSSATFGAGPTGICRPNRTSLRPLGCWMGCQLPTHSLRDEPPACRK